MIDWGKTSREDIDVIDRIVKRARKHGINREVIYLHMDLCAAHITCPLKLEELLEANTFDFVHDVVGIVNHLNRETGELEDCFVPRYAARIDKQMYGPEKEYEESLAEEARDNDVRVEMENTHLGNYDIDPKKLY